MTMAKKVKAGSTLQVKTTAGRIRHAIVQSVTTQDSVSVSIGKATAIAVTRAASTTTRGTIFNQ
jgi:predicted SPOUT superfamily RNA methylase MTH1